MAGGKGERLRPLTERRSKPAVPMGGCYRLVDFVLSNLINSEIRAVYLLVQYKSQSLIEHIRKAWTVSSLISEQFVTVVPPQMKQGQSWFMGTADAVYQNLNLIEEQQPDIVAVFGADHIYRMDIQQMVWFHLQHQADVSVAALPVPVQQASNFGIIQADTDCRIKGFQEKPQHPDSMPAESDYAYASMGNYLFNAQVLFDALKRAHKCGETDFGRHVLPRLVKTHRLFAYDFSGNKVPGIKDYEEHAYWRDVGSLDAYYKAHQDMLGIEPRFDAFNPQWPIYSSNDKGSAVQLAGGDIHNTLLGSAAIVNQATIHNSIIRREVVIEPGAELHDCIIMDYVHIGRGVRLRRVIVDQHNTIQDGECIGFDLEQDRQRYHVTASGLVVIPAGKVNFFARKACE